MFWRKKEPKVEQPKPVKPPPPEMFQVVEEVDLFSQNFTIRFEDGNKASYVLWEYTFDSTLPSQDPNDPYGYTYRYFPQILKRSLPEIRNELMSAASSNASFTLDYNTSTPTYLSMKGVKEITFEEPEWIDKVTVVYWTQEE